MEARISRVIDQRPAVDPTGAQSSLFHLSPRDRKRIRWAAVLSIYYHALIMSIQFGATGVSILGITIPYPQKRVETLPLKARIVQVPRPLPPAAPTPPVASPELPAPAAATEPQRGTSSRLAMTVELSS